MIVVFALKDLHACLYYDKIYCLAAYIDLIHLNDIALYFFHSQGLVIAGLSDLARPADTISVTSCGALAATGIIWSRYSMVIIPKNYGLFAVNLFVGMTQLVQLGRAYNYQLEQEKLQKENPAKDEKPALTQWTS